MKFIPIDKMKQLREASKNGNDAARKILDMQLGGKDDFSSLLEEFFTPKQEPEIEEEEPDVEIMDAGLQTFLTDNKIDKDNPEYQSYVEDYYRENPRHEHHEHHEEHEDCECIETLKKLMKEELDAIESYSKAITQTMGCEELDDGTKRKIISRLEEIKGDETEHFAELKQLLKNCKHEDNRDE